MRDFLLLMHDDTTAEAGDWGPYLTELQQQGVFQGGSAIGDGACVRKSDRPGLVTTKLVGYIRISAESLDQARSFISGNPAFEAGGTVEIRELPLTD